MKFQIYNYKEVTSTNDIALKLIKDKELDNGCIYAENQSKGRGTQGKKWISKKGNLFLTIFFKLKDYFPPFNEFTIINPVIISDVIKNLFNGHKISVKWPNDIFFNGKKVCGILQELITYKNKKFLIIGVGINVDSNPNINEKYKTTNIFNETNKKVKINELLDLIISSYELFFLNLDKYEYINYKNKAESIALG